MFLTAFALHCVCRSILSLFPVSGSFQANPPYCEELMEAFVDHVDRLLHNTNEPLSFIVFLPDFREPPARALLKLESSRFKRKQLNVAAFEHEFRNGYQHICDANEMNIKSQHQTLIIFLQNDAGFLRWGPSPDRIEALLDSYKARKGSSSSAADKELSLLSPPLTPASTATDSPTTTATTSTTIAGPSSAGATSSGLNTNASVSR